jgi:hypothetical protein
LHYFTHYIGGLNVLAGTTLKDTKKQRASLALLTVEQATKNIAKVARRATDKQWLAGSRWYDEANEFCSKLAAHENFPVSSVAGCLAALSPQCSWSNNLLGTISMVRTRQVTGGASIYPVNVSKAFSIVHENARPEEVLGGNKVKAFYANILNPRYSKAVTVDTHAARAAFGEYKLSAQQVGFAFRDKGNRIIQQAYRNVAKRYHVLPMRLQATVWLRVKADLIKKPQVEQLGLYIK